eukprot:TRINITY_DN17173_c0_g2_i1.p1 TRINITY_DN17173_c0_g2~~TRINITY_DN17173_c0_g2_i1.p1  ORF type:complete len:781 (+),score=198.68 TRINITY_DN17173_c0_g2_i1:160-2502(+)
MTVYYDVRAGVTGSATRFKDTVFSLVVKGIEFWVFLIFHGALVALVRYGVVDIASVGVPVESASLVQFFVTFLTTFYNKHCYQRYLQLYERCTDIIDAVLLIVFELSVSMNAEQLRAHRTLATKYVLATVYILFMGLTGGEMSQREWRELVHKGLLTRVETETLARYPGKKVTLVLMNWTMQVVGDALDIDEVFWTRPNQQRIAHVHNRINNHILELIRNCEMVGNIIALPIPFPYYHLMNLVLVLNFLLVAFVLSMFGTFGTIPMYGVVVSIFLGLREVANQLSDPFGKDSVDFPVQDFLNYVMSQAICLLEVVGCMGEEALEQAIQSTEDFSSEQVKMPVSRDKLYVTGDRRNGTYDWNVATPLYHLEVEESITAHLKETAKPKPILSQPEEETPEMIEQRHEEELRLLREEREALDVKLSESKKQLEELELLTSHERVVGPTRRSNEQLFHRRRAARCMSTISQAAAIVAQQELPEGPIDPAAFGDVAESEGEKEAAVEASAEGAGNAGTEEARPREAPLTTAALPPASSSSFPDFGDARRRIQKALEDAASRDAALAAEGAFDVEEMAHALASPTARASSPTPSEAAAAAPAAPAATAASPSAPVRAGVRQETGDLSQVSASAPVRAGVRQEPADLSQVAESLTPDHFSDARARIREAMAAAAAPVSAGGSGVSSRAASKERLRSSSVDRGRALGAIAAAADGSASRAASKDRLSASSRDYAGGTARSMASAAAGGGRGLSREHPAGGSRQASRERPEFAPASRENSRASKSRGAS